MITLNDLTQRQVELCDMLWDCNTDEDFMKLCTTLSDDDCNQIDVLKEMMIQESLEEELSLMERYPDAEAMLDRLKKDYL